MAYIRIKKIKGNNYYYLVRSIRIKNKVKKIEKYLGRKKPTSEQLQKFNVSISRYLTEQQIEKVEKLKHEFDKKYKSLSSIAKEKFIKGFLIKFTYNTNRIEGSTLSLRETSLILVDRIMPKGKTSKEVKEAENHAEAFNYMLKEKADLNLEFILKLHSILLKNIDENAGHIREEDVGIYGVMFKPPHYEELDYELKAFFEWYKEARILHPFELACLVHLKFVTIHPFTDGNGRISRLLMNFILKKYGYPMLDIPYEDREDYYNALETCQLEVDEKPFIGYCFNEYLMQSET
ncbi:MAG: Fic family protein [Nanoarchaeota archaeon]